MDEDVASAVVRSHDLRHDFLYAFLGNIIVRACWNNRGRGQKKNEGRPVKNSRTSRKAVAIDLAALEDAPPRLRAPESHANVASDDPVRERFDVSRGDTIATSGPVPADGISAANC